MENQLNIYSLTILKLQGILQPLLIKCQQQLAPPHTPPSAKSAFPQQLMTASSAAVYVFRILSSVYSLSQGALLSAVSKNVLNVFAERKGARGLFLGRAEPCNHQQMTGLPGSASKTRARFLSTNSQPAWADSTRVSLQKSSKLAMDSLVLASFRFSWGLNFLIWWGRLRLPSLVTENLWKAHQSFGSPRMRCPRDGELAKARVWAPCCSVIHGHWRAFFLLESLECRQQNWI